MLRLATRRAASSIGWTPLAAPRAFSSPSSLSHVAVPRQLPAPVARALEPRLPARSSGLLARLLHRSTAVPAGASSSSALTSPAALRAAPHRLGAAQPSAFGAVMGARHMSAWKMTGKKDRKKAKRARHGLGRARAMPVRVKVNRKRKPGEHKKVKLKSHKGALKRFYQTGDGTFMHMVAGKRHMMAGASRSRQTARKLKHKPIVTKGQIKKLKRLLPYGTTMRPPRRHREPIFWERPEGWTEAVSASKRAPHVLPPSVWPPKEGAQRRSTHIGAAQPRPARPRRSYVKHQHYVRLRELLETWSE